MSDLVIRSAYSPRLRVTFATIGDSLTKQSFKRECDVNVILGNYSQTGLPETGNNFGNFGFVDSLDYQDCMQKVIEAQAMFNGLPSKIRKRFNNDPSELMSFIADSSNRAEAEKLGLLLVVESSQEPDPFDPPPDLTPVPKV